MSFLPSSLAAQPFVDVPHQQTLQQAFQFFAKRIGQFDILFGWAKYCIGTHQKLLKCFEKVAHLLMYHCQRHPVDLVFVFGFVLPKRRMTLQQFVQHAAQAEPVGRRIVRCALRQHFGRHIAMCADRGVRLLLGVITGES